MENKLLNLSKKFYDPLYDVITLKSKEHSFITGRKFWASASLRPLTVGTIENIIYDLLNTYEMNRLNFLKQAGLSYLFLPSATHTRFAHSLGTYYLGEQAILRSWFQKSKNSVLPLGVWLMDNGLLDDFLVALLLADIGHFPFNHIIENNNCLYDDTVDGDSEIRFDHKDIACELIDPKSSPFRFYSSFEDLVNKKSAGKIDKDLFLTNKLNKYDTLDKKIIKYLITGKKIFLENLDDKKKRDVEVLKHLTNGLIDLNKMDHYRRDSYFMGVKLSNFNVLGLLDDVILSHNGIILKEDGINHALALLQGKEYLTEGVFEDKINIAYNSMLNYAIEDFITDKSEYDKSKYDEVFSEIIFLTDDELLNHLELNGKETVKEIVFKIKNREPYKLLPDAPFNGINLHLETRNKVVQLNNKVITAFNLDDNQKHQLIFNIPKNFSKKNKIDNWMDLELLHDVNGNNIGKSTKEIEKNYFKKKQDERVQKFHVYYSIELEEKSSQIGKKIGEYVHSPEF